MPRKVKTQEIVEEPVTPKEELTHDETKVVEKKVRQKKVRTEE
ncbi:MAG: hypothetical protein RLZZ196_3100 [Bacteroidota bacterium]|jgi:hypothetical protein